MDSPRKIRFLGLRDSNSTRDVFADLDRRYSEPHRSYHNWLHIDRLIDLFDTHLDMCRDRIAVELAIWFHDSIYIPGNPNNESESGRLLRAQTQRMMIDPAQIEAAVALVVATRHKQDPYEPMLDRDSLFLTDMDLSIFGSDPGIYDAYAKSIGIEYSKLPPDRFAAGRIRILEDFLDRPHIYSTAAFITNHEESARANLVREIALLRKRLP